MSVLLPPDVSPPALPRAGLRSGLRRSGRAAAVLAGLLVAALAPAQAQPPAPADPVVADTAAFDAAAPDSAFTDTDEDVQAPWGDADEPEAEEADPEALPVLEPPAPPRPPPSASLAQLQADPDFQYTSARGAERPSLGRVLWRWFEKTVLDPFFRTAATKPGQTSLGLAAFALLVALAVWLARGGIGGLRARRDAEATAEASPFYDAVARTDLDLDARWRAARDAGQWREALRWRFLRSLRRLDDVGVIAWDRHKTDADYLREVRRRAGPDAARAFADAARAFAWVWYGEADLDAARAARIEQRFDRLDASAGPDRAAAGSDFDRAVVPAEVHP